jgi:uncharacterized YccA/Bax inhibitor family protein
MPYANPALNERVFDREMGEDAQPGWAAPGGSGSATTTVEPQPQPQPWGAPPSPPPGGAGFGGGRGGRGGSGGGGDGWSAAPSFPAATTGERMTLAGTFTASLVLFVLLLAGGAWGWQLTSSTKVVDQVSGAVSYTYHISPWAIVAVFVAFGLAMVTIFKPKLARLTGALYAVVEGVALGAISALFELQFKGIVLQAVLATAAVFAVMLFLYASRIVKVTAGFRRAILGAMFGILILYGVTLFASLFGADIAFWNQPSLLGIGITILIAGVAAFRLMLDFDFIERAVEAGAPRYLEWYSAFGLMVGLVWLYLELLRLIALLRRR